MFDIHVADWSGVEQGDPFQRAKMGIVGTDRRPDRTSGASRHELARPRGIMTSDVGSHGGQMILSLEVPSLEDLPNPAGRHVLVRADLDLPMGFTGNLEQSRHLQQIGPTVRWLSEHHATVTICGHQGPLGSVGDPIRYGQTADALRQLYPGVTVSPNLSEWDGAHEDPDLLTSLLQGQDLFVNDDFQHCSTSLASIVGPPTVLPSAAGRQLQRDLGLLRPLLTQPERPLVVVLGSRDTLDRIRNLYSLVLRADAVLVGGQMSQPFLEAIGHQPLLGDTAEFLEDCRHAYGVGNTIQHSIHLPSDLVWECKDGSTTTAEQRKVVDGSIGDIGPKTGIEFGDVLRGAGSILWVGSLGEVEDDRFVEGTLALGRALTGSSARIVLGGDALLHTLRRNGLVPESAEFVSATGSAVALLKDGDLPGLMVLRQASNATRTQVAL
jgi:phosphoglycerate kinase